jgi:hypothetical protein
MKDEIDAVQGRSMNLRKSLMHELSQTQDLSHENKLLKQKLATYRRMVQAQNNNAKNPPPKQPVVAPSNPTVVASSTEQLAPNTRPTDVRPESCSQIPTVDSQGQDEGRAQ